VSYQELPFPLTMRNVSAIWAAEKVVSCSSKSERSLGRSCSAMSQRISDAATLSTGMSKTLPSPSSSFVLTSAEAGQLVLTFGF